VLPSSEAGRIEEAGIEVEQTSRQALAAFAAKNYAEAERLCREILAVDRDHFEAHHLLGGVRSLRGDWIRGLQHFEAAAGLRPDSVEATDNRARALRGMEGHAIKLARERRYQDALPFFDLLHESEPENCETLNNRGNTQCGLSRFNEALADYDRAIALKPDHVDAHANRSTVLVHLGRYEDALAAIEHVLPIAAGTTLVQHNYGYALDCLGRYDEALVAYGRALELTPDEPQTLFNRALLYLRTGDFERGWQDMEVRARHPHFPTPRTFPEPLWLGETSLRGKRLLVHAEQGQGDTIQVARFLPRLAAEADEVIFEVQPGLVRLLTSLKGPLAVLAQGIPLPPFDVQIPTMSLPLACKVTLGNIPAPPSYLAADPQDVAKWRVKLGPKKRRLRVGVAWAGNPAHRNDHRRSMPEGLLNSLEGPEVEIVVLQRERRNDLFDFAETAALIDCLDLTIAVDTAVVHLAGAIGAPVWTLLPTVPDWRWFDNRGDSPWYPSMTIYRQKTSGDWDELIERVRRHLVRVEPRAQS
jgi:tetratricopeptide (TPR) repeat protein